VLSIAEQRQDGRDLVGRQAGCLLDPVTQVAAVGTALRRSAERQQPTGKRCVTLVGGKRERGVAAVGRVHRGGARNKQLPDAGVALGGAPLTPSHDLETIR